MRTLRFAALLAVASISAQPAQAQNFIPRDALIAMVEVHKASLLRYLDAAPDSMLGYRPVPGVRTFAEQIEHAAWGNAYIAHTAITGSDKVPSFGAADKSYLKTKDGLRTYSVAAMDHTITMLRALPDAAMTEPITQFGKQLPRYRALMELLDHFPWTLGQTVVYLRENGVKPPTYTPF